MSKFSLHIGRETTRRETFGLSRVPRQMILKFNFEQLLNNQDYDY